MGKTVYIEPTMMTVLFSCNVIIIPVVDHMCQMYGITHRVDVDKDSLIPAEEGKYKLLPEDPDSDTIKMYIDVIKQKLLLILKDEDLEDDSKLHIVKLIMKKNFRHGASYRDSLTFEKCISYIIGYIIIKAWKGYQKKTKSGLNPIHRGSKYYMSLY